MNRAPSLAPKTECTGCMLCANVCAVSAISFCMSSNGFWRPVVNKDKCVGCLRCEKECKNTQCFSNTSICAIPLKGFSLSENIRKRSTSGGIFFTLAAASIKEHKAIVYGAACIGNRIKHIAVEKESDLHLLQGSKYAQSNTEDVYFNVKKDLDNGRHVLFSGTPCQVAALRTYLRREYANLLTIDLICHGVPSNKLIERHLAINKGDTISEFRTKKLGWGRDSHISFSRAGKVIMTPAGKMNLFYHAFQSELCFRPSCYKCRYNSIERVGDITIGDYWAARFSKEEYDPLGISTILPNTTKGAEAIATCSGLHTEEAQWRETLNYNPRLCTDRKEYMTFSLSEKIGTLYRWLPNRIADYIIEAWYSKHRPLFFLWAYYIQHRKKQAERIISYRHRQSISLIENQKCNE